MNKILTKCSLAAACAYLTLAPAFAQTPGESRRPARGTRPHPPRIQVFADCGPSARELELKEQELELQRQELERRKNNDRLSWQLETEDRDRELEQSALDASDGKCADYFCGVRCTRRDTSDGFCAKHAREHAKGLKQEKYAAEAARRY